VAAFEVITEDPKAQACILECQAFLLDALRNNDGLEFLKSPGVDTKVA